MNANDYVTEMEWLPDFAGNLKYCLEREGISLKLLCKEACISTSTGSRYMNGQMIPLAHVIQNVCYSFEPAHGVDYICDAYEKPIILYQNDNPIVKDRWYKKKYDYEIDMPESVVDLRKSISLQEWQQQFSNRLEIVMNDRQVTEQELADMSLMTRKQICEYLHCKSIPKVTSIINLKHALGCSARYLIDFGYYIDIDMEEREQSLKKWKKKIWVG